ncbi:MAG: isochorismatase family protein [Clostridia bacterium]|nr:isochorismatase family protein [Clostridia bacterium]
MKSFNSSQTALLVIDIQNFYFDKEQKPAEHLIPAVQKVLQKCRENHVPVIHVRHIWGDNDKDPIFDFWHETLPLEGEKVITKRTPGSFFGTELEQVLKELKVENLIITGMKTNHCCDTTTREAAARGYKVTIINEGVGTFDIVGIDGQPIKRELIQYVVLSVLRGFGECMSIDEFMNCSIENQ